MGPAFLRQLVEEQRAGVRERQGMLPANLKVKVAALVRAKARGSGTAQSAERAATLRAAIKRLTDAYTWGALGEADTVRSCAS